jgi:hypothetical protein
VERRQSFKCLFKGAAKSDFYARHAYPTVNWSVSPHGTVRLPPEVFSEKFILTILLKSGHVFGFLLKLENNSKNSKWRRMYIDDNVKVLSDNGWI